MAKNSVDAYGAKGKGNVLQFDPETLELVTDPAHPLYDERVHAPLQPAMVANIKAIGVHTAISVIKDPETGKVLVAAGRQRVKNAREANRQLIAEGLPPRWVPGIVTTMKLVDTPAIMISENEHRQADTPLGRANKMRQMLSLGRDEDWLALHFGCSIQTVRQTLSLLESTAAVREAVEAGHITATAAHKLAKLSPEEQRDKVAELVKAGEGATGHARSKAQRAVLDGDKPRPPTRKEIAAERDRSTGERRAALSWVLGEGGAA